MAQIKLLKIGSTGIPTEFDSAADDITLHSFVIQGGGPELTGSGLDLKNQPLSNVTNVSFQDPSVDHINQTAGNLTIDNLMAKDRGNTLAIGADILFPQIADNAGQVDILRLPSIATAPTATPTATGEGFLVYDRTAKKTYIWDGTVWQDQTVSSEARSLVNMYSAGEALSACDAVYISAADKVSKAKATSVGNEASVIGFAASAAALDDAVGVQEGGVMGGFSSLTAGARYFLSNSVAGAITTSVPASSGSYVVQVGYAKSSSELAISLNELGRRA